MHAKPEFTEHTSCITSVSLYPLRVERRMRQSLKIRVSIAIAVAGTLPSLAIAGDQNGDSGDYEQAIFNLTGIEYAGGPPAISGAFDVDPNRQIMRLRWEDVVLETYQDNTGTPNWASEVYFGILAVDQVGEPLGWLEQPFPDDYSSGTFGPVDGEVSLELENVFTGPSGTVSVLTASSFVDGSGLPVGHFIGGTLIIEYMGIPSPGGLALLAAAAWRTRRRRR
jgi:hypothetical protein